MNNDFLKSIARVRVIDPEQSIAKLGAGANLYMLIQDGSEPYVKPVNALSLDEVVTLVEANKPFIEIVTE